MKKITIHQPEHLPYQGFFAKVLQSDIFVVLDHIQFRKNYFQNRNKIINEKGQEVWLTLGLEKSTSDSLINQKKVSKDPKWRKKYINQLNESYKKSKNFKKIFPEIKNLILSDNKKLLDINLNIILFILKEIFNYKGDIILSSKLNINSFKSDLILDICKSLSADIYISGPSGNSYLDKKSFLQNDIKLKFIDYKPIEFTKGHSTFISIIDPLMKYEFNYVKQEILRNTKLK